MIYDLIVIGGGPAGYRAAESAGRRGMKVLVFEKNRLGGVCLNEGCIPTKAMLYSAKLYEGAKKGESYGVYVTQAHLGHGAVLERKSLVVHVLGEGINAAMKTAGVEVIRESAKINCMVKEGFEVCGGINTYTAKNVLIASGSGPIIPPIKGVQEALNAGFIITSKELLKLKLVPERLAIVGGGVIGLELAVYFASAGSKVTVIEMMDHIGGNLDNEIGLILKKNLEKRGIQFCLKAQVTEVEDGIIRFVQEDETSKITADKVLLSVGRCPSTQGIGLERLGIKTELGAIQTDQNMQTAVKGVYAAGDVTGGMMLAHKAYREADIAVNHMCEILDEADYTAIPSVIYTIPEVASAGVTVEEAEKKGINVVVRKLSMNYSGRYFAENKNGDGMIKIVVDNESRRLIGVHMIGSYASEIIQSAVILIQAKLTVEEIKRFVFPHPTVCEIIRDAVCLF